MKIGRINGYTAYYKSSIKKEPQKTKKQQYVAPHVEKNIDKLASKLQKIGLYNKQGAKIVAKSIVTGNINIVA
ncbi:hypothetical protein EV215_1589 [Hypnocyclicus thermotrophus]|uniref:Uncharacterized protein n=1 Tax=Hypnocyclicus thermotrophus TaxID=1627895 RepID=A0AA46DXJ0_9FUSO|nr:hypothetical protein [Hypnocyclicus thermotrophus]TDT68522.1 hypothetical protein EV215_1589 [Hypnocyclicus thermotrophus]